MPLYLFSIAPYIFFFCTKFSLNNAKLSLVIHEISFLKGIATGNQVNIIITLDNNNN